MKTGVLRNVLVDIANMYNRVKLKCIVWVSEDDSNATSLIYVSLQNKEEIRVKWVKM